jgi:hypothetical protein
MGERRSFGFLMGEWEVKKFAVGEGNMSLYVAVTYVYLPSTHDIIGRSMKEELHHLSWKRGLGLPLALHLPALPSTYLTDEAN